MQRGMPASTSTATIGTITAFFVQQASGGADATEGEVVKFYNKVKSVTEAGNKSKGK